VRYFVIYGKDRKQKKGYNPSFPANLVLLRGFEMHKTVESFEKRYRMKACCIAGHVGIKGISRYLRIRSINVKGSDITLNTNLEGKVEALEKNFKKYYFLFLHINCCDFAGHKKSFQNKKEFIEKIDYVVFSEIKNMKANIVLTCDHRTSVNTGEHEFGSVLALFFSYKENLSNGIKILVKENVKKVEKLKI